MTHTLESGSVWPPGHADPAVLLGPPHSWAEARGCLARPSIAVGKRHSTVLHYGHGMAPHSSRGKAQHRVTVGSQHSTVGKRYSRGGSVRNGVEVGVLEGTD